MRDLLIAACAVLLCTAALAQQPAPPAEAPALPPAAPAPPPAAAPALPGVAAPPGDSREIVKQVQRARTRAYSDPLVLDLLGRPQPPDNVQIDVDLQAVPPADALRRVFGQAKREYVIQTRIPDGPPITVKAHRVALSSVLDLITQHAGIRWSRERAGDGVRYRIGKRGREEIEAGGLLAPGEPAPLIERIREGLPGLERIYKRILVDPEGSEPFVFSKATTERVTTFVCPHCRGKVTSVRAATQPKCAKCSRSFQSDWQFCPVDGARRPADPANWRYCPLCGKAVDVEKAGQR